MQVSPDKENFRRRKEGCEKLRLSKSQYIQIKDPQRGKPFALKMARKRVNGDIVIWTDGDISLEETL